MNSQRFFSRQFCIFVKQVGKWEGWKKFLLRCLILAINSWQNGWLLLCGTVHCINIFDMRHRFTIFLFQMQSKFYFLNRNPCDYKKPLSLNIEIFLLKFLKFPTVQKWNRSKFRKPNPSLHIFRVWPSFYKKIGVRNGVV